MTDLAAWLLSLAAIASGAVCRPQRVRCPPGWRDWDGVRPSGEFTCAPPLVGPDQEVGQPDPSVQPTPMLRAAAWCREGSVPEVDWDGAGVTCR